MLEGSFTFKGITLDKAYLDLNKLTLENGIAIAQYKVYANHDTFKSDSSQYLTTHTETFVYTQEQIQTLLDNGKKEAKKEGKKFNNFTDYVPPKGKK